MLNKLWDGLSRKRRSVRNRLAQGLLRRIEDAGVLFVERDTHRTIKASRKGFFRAALDLVMSERIYMLSDADGRVVLMTNAEFTKFMMRRSVTRETEIRSRKASPSASDAAVAVAVAELDETGESLVEQVFVELFSAPPASETALTGADKALAVTADPDWLPSEPVGEVRTEETAGSENTLTRAAPHSEDDRFSLDIAPGEIADVIFPDLRQTLPERRREPWASLEDAAIDFYQ